MRPRPGTGRTGAIVRHLACLALLLAAGPARGDVRAVRLRVTFQPDCHRPSLSSACDPRKSGMRLDLGPQIAVWVESADGTRFVDTIMVTRLIARLGLGNRPGHWSLPSSPKFPYGKRPMALPVWAHRRGRLYDTLVMQDGVDKELWLGFHESVSSPDPYFCRPMSLAEIDVDAITCPTKIFNSAKGRFFKPDLDLAPKHLAKDGNPKPYVPPPRSYYPPRTDLTIVTDRDCDGISTTPMCSAAAERFRELNDLDAVATATPPYGRPFSKTWLWPEEVPDGDYAVFVEINKEFDGNASHAYTAYQDPLLQDAGLRNNFGQPSVVFRVPFRLSRTKPDQATTSALAGYGDWDGRTGTLHPPDATIADLPGSGQGRLLVLSVPSTSGGPPVVGRVHVATELLTLPAGGTDAGLPPDDEPDGGGQDAGTGETPGPPRCEALTVAVTDATVPLESTGAEMADVRFAEPTGPGWERIEEYDVRVWAGRDRSLAAFERGLPVPSLPRGAPGQTRTVTVPDLRSETEYVVGIRPSGFCLEGAIVYVPLTTGIRRFTQLSGCFVATAAWGSPLAAEVDVLRRVRDRARAAIPLAGVVTDAYARSSPPLAELLASSPLGRAVVREVLAPLVEVGRAGYRAQSLP